MTHALPQTALAALAEAGCTVPRIIEGGSFAASDGRVDNRLELGEYGQPAVEDMMEWLFGLGHTVGLYRSEHGWEAVAAPHGRTGDTALLALYALALAVGAVKEAA